MAKLYLVGVTEDRSGLVLSKSPRSKRGDSILEVDAAVLEAIAEIRRYRSRAGGAPALTSPALPSRYVEAGPEASRLSPREIQDRLRHGESLRSVARRAGVDESRLEVYATPILAEQARIVAEAGEAFLSKRGAGLSGRPLREAVLANVASRRVKLTASDFAAAWSSFESLDGGWIVRFSYTSRGKPQVAEWWYDPEIRKVVATNRLGTALGWSDPKVRGRLPVLPDGAAPPPPAPVRVSPVPVPAPVGPAAVGKTSGSNETAGRPSPRTQTAKSGEKGRRTGNTPVPTTATTKAAPKERKPASTAKKVAGSRRERTATTRARVPPPKPRRAAARAAGAGRTRAVGKPTPRRSGRPGPAVREERAGVTRRSGGAPPSRTTTTPAPALSWRDRARQDVLEAPEWVRRPVLHAERVGEGSTPTSVRRGGETREADGNRGAETVDLRGRAGTGGRIRRRRRPLRAR